MANRRQVGGVSRPMRAHASRVVANSPGTDAPYLTSGETVTSVHMVERVVASRALRNTRGGGGNEMCESVVATRDTLAAEEFVSVSPRLSSPDCPGVEMSLGARSFVAGRR